MHGIPLWLEVLLTIIHYLPWIIGAGVIVLAAWWLRRGSRGRE